ncbi:MAG: putative bifunctional diguanylate cyclase/phosphodiesterase [Pseudomarimonas sp.]
MNLPRHLSRYAVVLGLYVGGAVIGSEVLHGPDQVALIWLPSGVALASLLMFGRRYWLLLLLADLLSQTLLGAPWAFLPFSALANVLGAAVGATLAMRLGGRLLAGFAVRTGLAVLAGGILMSALSAPIGVAGLVMNGMTPPAEALQASAKWFTGNLFGVVLVAPALRLAFLRRHERRDAGQRMRFASRREMAIWCAVFALSAAVVMASAPIASTYALGLTSLPLALLLWSALRFPPLMTALGALLVGVGLALVAGIGIGGFFPPPSLFEAVVLLVFLSVVTLAPLFLAATTFESRIASSQMLRAASHDELTGLLNRVGFETQARRLIDGGGEEPMALAYIDLDQFKLINDTASHAVGDALVRSLAGVLTASIRTDDILARIGGDEFAVLLRKRLPLEAERDCEQLREAIAEFRYPHVGHVYSLTTSIGLVPFLPRRQDYPALLAQADAACFGAKEMGGNRVKMITTGDAARERSSAMLWAMRLTTALEQGNFRLYCQTISPLVLGLATGRHFEVLTRMTDPQTGALLQPDQFVAAAERFRLGTRLDRHVIELTLTWLESHPEALAEVELCGINLCAASVNDPEFLIFLRKRMIESTVPRGKLCFEITETSAIRDLGEARRFIDGVRALGCRLALDDFGTGFCSFAYLNALDVDYFKIDGSFVRELDTSPLSLSIVRAIADIARGINKRTVAEFVENEAIRDRLYHLGVDYAQGYVVDQPTPIDDYFKAPPPGLSKPLSRAA